jgi:hypothetical protein
MGTPARGFKDLGHANGLIVEIPTRKTKNRMQVAASPSLRAPEDAQAGSRNRVQKS